MVLQSGSIYQDRFSSGALGDRCIRDREFSRSAIPVENVPPWRVQRDSSKPEAPAGSAALGVCLSRRHLFHNAGAGRPHTGTEPGPFRLAQETAARDGEYYRREPDVGSLALFVRTQRPFP